jgi:hypothetical protein
MAEPYDTLNAIGSGPALWYRFSDASGGVTNEGSLGAGENLIEANGDTGTFNWTYEYEDSPAEGAGKGMLAGGQGGLKSGNTGLTAKGTMVYVYRTNGTPGSSQHQVSFYDGGDAEGIQLAVDNAGRLRYRIQDAGADDEGWVSGAATYADNKPHSFIVSPGITGSNSQPQIFVDGVLEAFSHEEDTTGGPDTVPNDFWWDLMTESLSVGLRDSFGDFEASNLVFYEVMAYNDIVDADEAADIHRLLARDLGDFSNKTIRRRNRRIFNDFL